MVSQKAGAAERPAASQPVQGGLGLFVDSAIDAALSVKFKLLMMELQSPTEVDSGSLDASRNLKLSRGGPGPTHPATTERMPVGIQ